MVSIGNTDVFISGGECCVPFGNNGEALHHWVSGRALSLKCLSEGFYGFSAQTLWSIFSDFSDHQLLITLLFLSPFKLLNQNELIINFFFPLVINL